MNNAAEKNARILIVDDSEMNRDMLSDMLSDDYDIVEAANGEKALSILKEQVYDIDLAEIKPIVAKPHFVDNVVPADEAKGVKIDEAFLGSCNNGRIEDLRVGAAIVKGKHVHGDVRFMVVPASRDVY